MIVSLKVEEPIVDAIDECARRLGLSRAAWVRLTLMLALRDEGALPTKADHEGDR